MITAGRPHRESAQGNVSVKGPLGYLALHRTRAWGWILWAAGLGVFVAMAVAANSSDEFPGDIAISEEVQEIEFWGSNRLEEAADVVGSSLFVSGVAAALTLLLVWRRKWELAALAPSILLWRLAGTPIKQIVHRPRPHEPEAILRELPAGFSFPSGHALGAALLCGFVILMAERLLGGWKKRALEFVAVVLALGVGFERVYDGAHWTSDVAGGFLLGGLVVGFVALGRPAALALGNELRRRWQWRKLEAPRVPGD